MEDTNYLREVRKQYEDYPYPARAPEDEKRRLIQPMTDCLDRVNHYCFEGKKDFLKGGRILVAGGGTGDAVIFLAEQLRDSSAEIVYVDVSLASMSVAKQRAEVRGLTNVDWLHASLLDLPSLAIGKFDYINCSGVLHHLAEPGKGLAALNSVLNDNGAMAIMVYGKYGRTAIYQMQELMRIVNQNENDMLGNLDNCKAVLRNLPKSNWFMMSSQSFLQHLATHNEDIEIYDLLLHAQDRAYSIPELYRFLEKEGLRIVRLFGMHQKPDPEQQETASLYDPAAYIRDEGLLKKMQNLTRMDQQAIAELLHGGIGKHTFYAAREKKPLPSLDDMDNIPFLDIQSGRHSYEMLYDVVRKSGELVNVVNQHSGKRASFTKTPHAEGFFKYMDGNTTLKDIFRKIMASPKYKRSKPTIPRMKSEFSVIFDALNRRDWIFLRFKTVGYPVTVDEMHARIDNVQK